MLQAITWANVDPDLRRHMVSLCSNVFNFENRWINLFNIVNAMVANKLGTKGANASAAMVFT